MKIYKLTNYEQNEEQIEYRKIQDIVDQRDKHYRNILREYYDKKRKKGSMMSWEVIPFQRLKKIWTDYSIYGVVRDIDGMQFIVDKMMDILARLNAATDLAGHSQVDSETIEDITGYKRPKGNNVDFYFDFLETQYGSPISDFGLPQLNNLAWDLIRAKTPEEQLTLVDQMLNVVHQRGDLAALFIEGGIESLSQLAGN